MKAVIEGLLFLSGNEGISLKELCEITEQNEETIKSEIKNLYNDYESNDRGINIEYLGNRFKLTTKAIHKDYYKKLVREEENAPLTQSALETLAIIAYNGPITRIDVDNIRGVNSSYIIRKLLIKDLIEEKGISDSPGKPKLYGVTNNFLDYFGLGSIEELPEIKIDDDNIIDDENDLYESKYKEDL